MFQDGLFQYVTSQPSITAILGTPTTRSDKNSGMFAMLATTGAVLPYLVFQRISGSYSQTFQGADPFATSRWRFTCYGANQKSAVLLSKALKSLFKTFIGTFPDGTVVENVWLDLEADDSESLPHGTIFAVHLDFTFQYVDSDL